MSKEKDILADLADAIGKRAKEKFQSNVEFANMSDVNESSIRRILQGQQNISIKVLKRICESLDVKISDLLKETGN